MRRRWLSVASGQRCSECHDGGCWRTRLRRVDSRADRRDGRVWRPLAAALLAVGGRREQRTHSFTLRRPGEIAASASGRARENQRRRATTRLHERAEEAEERGDARHGGGVALGELVEDRPDVLPRLVAGAVEEGVLRGRRQRRTPSTGFANTPSSSRREKKGSQMIQRRSANRQAHAVTCRRAKSQIISTWSSKYRADAKRRKRRGKKESCKTRRACTPSVRSVAQRSQMCVRWRPPVTALYVETSGAVVYSQYDHESTFAATSAPFENMVSAQAPRRSVCISLVVRRPVSP